MSVVDSIQHYQRSIEKYPEDKERLLHCIKRLDQLPVTVQHLQDTGVGKAINSLRKSEGHIGECARALVAKWKRMVEAESDEEQEVHDNQDVLKRSYDPQVDKENLKRHHVDRIEKGRHKSIDQAGSSHGQGESSSDRKRKRDFDSSHVKDKRRRIDSEDDDIAGDADQYTNTVDSDSEQLLIEDKVVDSDMEYLQDELDNHAGSEEDYAEPRTPKHERSSSKYDDKYHDTNATVSELLTHKDSKHSSSHNSNHRSHDKPSKKDRHSSNHVSSKHKSKSSSSHIKLERDSSQERSSWSEGDKKESSSSRSKSKDKESRGSKHSSSSSRSEHKLKEKPTESPLFLVKEEKRTETDRSRDGKDSKSRKSSNNEAHSEKSMSRDKDKSKDRHKDKHDEKNDKDSKSKSKKKDKEKARKKETDVNEDGVDSFSGTSFAEALGMCIPEKPKKKTSNGPSPSTSKSSKAHHTSPEKKPSVKDFLKSPSELELHCSSMPLEPLDVDEDIGLPMLNPNYKPLPQPNFYNSPTKKALTEDEALTNLMYSKVQRTKVFSGNKCGYTSVPSLFEMCTRVLQENIDALEFTGGVPFDLLKSVLERASPDQLFNLEHFNPYLIEDTDAMWEFHCRKYFRNKKREELETWREMYLRCQDERERKLKSLTANIAAASKAKLLPVRTTKLAYVEGTVKPPRNIAKKQAKFGTASAVASSSAKPIPSSSPGLSSSFTGRSSSINSQNPAVSVPTPRGSSGGHQQPSSCKPRPKAPLMQKALQLVKNHRLKR